MTIFNPMEDESPNGWLITPAYNLVMFVSEELVLAAITERALMTYSAMPQMIFAAKQTVERLKIDTNGAFDRLEEFVKLDADFAKSEEEMGFDTVYRHHCAGVWAAMETGVERTIKNLMLHVPDAGKKK